MQGAECTVNTTVHGAECTVESARCRVHGAECTVCRMLDVGALSGEGRRAAAGTFIQF